MRSKKLLVIVVSVVLVLAMVVGAVYFFLCNKNYDEPNNTDPITTINPDDIQHTVGESVIEFDEGNEVFLDESLILYLERMETGVPAVDNNGNYYLHDDGEVVYNYSQEKSLEGVLDNLILLINHFAKAEYSMDAIHQIQRFYVEYHDRFAKIPFEKMANKIAECFPREGADPETLNDRVIEVFGYNRGDNCAFVFYPVKVAPIKVEFYNVLPKTVELEETMKSLCVYDNLHNEDDDGYERNLEVWLHNVISVASEAGLSEEKIIAAQIIYAGSIADAEYRQDWAAALVKCLSIENWNYDNLKLAVDAEFSVCLDYNVSIQDYFESLNEEVVE
jgi:hypothetical protein